MFHALLIYVLYSAFGLLWYCRALTRRLTIAVKGADTKTTGPTADLPVLMRFDQYLAPSVFFSFGRGNVKPRTNYVLLLGSIAFLFLWITVASFRTIYSENPYQGALLLAIYLALEFMVVFALSGVGHELAYTHSDFLNYVDRKSRKEAPRV